MADDNLTTDYLQGREAAKTEDRVRFLEGLVGGQTTPATAAALPKATEQVETEDRTKRHGVVGGLATQAIGGVRDAVVQAGKSVEDLTGWLRTNTPLGALPEGPKLNLKLPIVRKPSGLAEEATRGIAQFLTGFLPLLKATKAAGLGTGAAGAVAGAATDFAVFDPADPRVSNLLNEMAPALRNPITDYLAAQPGDSAAEGRFKNVLEGLGLGAMAEGVFKAVKVLKTAKGLTREELGTLATSERGAVRVGTEVADEAPSVTTLGIPKTVQRTEEAGVSSGGVGKPHGLYTTPGHLESPHADLGGAVTRFQTNPTAKVLHLDEAVAGRDVAMRPGAIDAGAGVHAAYQLLGPEEFSRLKGLSKADLIEAATRIDPATDWTRYFDKQEVMEGIGGTLARRAGYDAMWLADKASPAFSEYVALSERAFLREGSAKIKVPALVQVTRATPEEVKAFMTANPDALNLGDRVLKVGWEHLGDQAGLEEVINRTTHAFRDRVEVARRGKISDESLRVLARDLDMSVEDFLSRRLGAAMNAEQSLALVSLLGASAKRLRGLAGQVAGGNLELRQAMIDQLSVHAAIQEQAFGVRAEAGRALRVWGMDADGSLRHATKLREAVEQMGGRTGVPLDADRLADMILAVDDPAKLAKMTREAMQPGWTDMAMEYWINALLSNPVTHVTNFLSNTLTALWAIPERALAAQLNPRGQGVVKGEATEMLWGLVGGTMDGLRLAGKAFRDGVPVREGSKVENYTRKAISGATMGTSGTLGQAIDLLGTGVRLPGRFLMASDEFFKAINFRMELHAQALRQATTEGLEGKAGAARVAALLQDPDFLKRVKPLADEFADYQTFTKALGETGSAILAFRDSHPLAKLVLPFIRTPTNIFKYVGERTPYLNRLSIQVRSDIAAGGARADLARARVQLGGMVMASTAVLASSGYITGRGPRDPNLRREWLETHQPYSVKLGGTWYGFNRLDPLGANLGMAGDFADMVGDLDEIDASQLAAAAALSVSNNMLSKTYLTGLSDVLEAMQSPTQDAAQAIKRLAGTLVPSGVAQAARTLDPTLREVNSITDAMIARVPGWSSTLPPKMNLWAEPIRLEGALGPDLFSPIYTKTAALKPVSEEMERQGVSVAMPAKWVFGTRQGQDPLVQPSAKDGVPLEPEEYAQYVRLAAGHGLGIPLLKATLATLIASDTYKAQSDGPDGMKAKLIRDVIFRYRNAAQGKLIAESPALQAQLERKALQRGRALTPPSGGLLPQPGPMYGGERPSVGNPFRDVPGSLGR